MLNISWFDDGQNIIQFPAPGQALEEPDGLLAVGGNLSVETLTHAYSQGVFPWYAEYQPILWWSPSKRAIIKTKTIHISKNMAKLIRQARYSICIDKDFDRIIESCANASLRRGEENGTWITEEMQSAYKNLHESGVAHCVSVYDRAGELVGGLYGVFVKNCFCGESMFSLAPNTSKLALIHLAQFLSKYGCNMIDCQLITPHLLSMGAEEVSRESFLQKLSAQKDNPSLINQRWNHL